MGQSLDSKKYLVQPTELLNVLYCGLIFLLLLIVPSKVSMILSMIILRQGQEKSPIFYIVFFYIFCAKMRHVVLNKMTK